MTYAQWKKLVFDSINGNTPLQIVTLRPRDFPTVDFLRLYKADIPPHQAGNVAIAINRFTKARYFEQSRQINEGEPDIT